MSNENKFKKILTLVGRGNNGKSTVLKQLIKKILSNESEYLVIDKDYTTNAEYIKYLDGLDEEKDVTCCIRRTKTGKMFAITTYGDEKSILQSQFNKAAKNNCKFVVCASHETDTMYKFLLEKSHSVERVYKFKELKADFKSYNSMVVDYLYYRINLSLKEL